MRCAGHTAVVLLATALAAGAASAEGLSGLIEEDLAKTRIDTTDQAGATQRLDTLLFTQRYRLNFDRTLWPSLRFATGGVLEQILGSTDSAGTSIDQSARTTNFYANLNLTDPILAGTLGYTRRQTGVSGSPISFINEEPLLALNWRPSELPSLSLRLSRASIRDSSRQIEDLVTNSATLMSQYFPIPKLELRYTFDYQNPQDHLHTTDTTTITQTGGANYADNFAPWRTSVATGANAVFRRTLVTSAGAGGTLATPVLPVAGMSLIEQFPAVPTLDSLAVNVALLDSNLTQPTQINLGYSATLAGDVANRDLGVQFADEITTVNTLFVWVDKQVLPDVVGQIHWTAYKSNDNQRWTEVPIVAPVAFPALQNRFEITIQDTQARFVKVVARPLLPAATTDTRMADILVTELQTYVVRQVTSRGGWEKSNTEVATAALRTQVGGWDDLAYDFTMTASRTEQSVGPTAIAWLVANGLSYSRKLNPVFALSARVARQDLDQSRGHEGDLLYSAALSADELPTLGHTLSYSGQTNMLQDGTTSQNSFAFFNRLTPYRGIGLLAGASYSLATTLTGQTSRTNVITVNATVQPHPSLTLTGTYGRTGTVALGGGQPTLISRALRYEGTASFNPFPALYASGGVQRTITDGLGYTLGNVALGFSPLQGGALQLTFSYNQTLDSAGALTRLITPGLRWTINRASVLTVTYAFIDTEGSTEVTHTRTLDVNLKIPL